jgi:two-component system sensor histidine kinase KdpD
MAKSWRGVAVAAMAVALVTGLGLVAWPHLAALDLAMLYVVAIMLAAGGGRGPALLAATLAVLAFDVCFIPPRFALVVADARHLVTFGVMFGAGLAIATLVERGRRLHAAALEATVRARGEELRSSILSLVSHDLRTPLAVILGATTSLREHGARLDDPARRELLDAAIEEAERLERVLGNLLELTRLETGLVPAREWVPVEELVGGALTRLERALGGRAVEVALEPDLAVSVDPVLFELVLINLLDNAIKHGAPPIAVRARRLGAEIELAIEDRGAGLPPGDEAALFAKFARASRAPGVGLGLAIVRGVVVAHGGRVEVGRGPAGGARFVVTLPVAAAASTVPEPPLVEASA